MVKRISQQKIVSYGSISSVNVDEIYSKNKLYHLTFISPSYSFAEKGEKGWSETDVLKRVENVRGDRV